MRVQHSVHEILSEGIREFSAIGGNAMVVDIKSGEILAMVSLPDFDPNVPSQNAELAAFNRNTLGVYEPGSTAKIINTSIALETGRIKLTSIYDAINPVKVGRFKITDFKGPNRMVTVKEGFLYSSNLVSARMALDFGLDWQRKFFHALGLLSKPTLEIPELTGPLFPKKPTEATLISNSFGYGISVSPLQIARAVAAILNDGQMRDLTLLKQKMPVIGAPVISKATSKAMRGLMRAVVEEGTGRKANVKGYPVLGKTGTAYKSNGKSYDHINKITSFVGAFPAHDPKYMVLLFYDSPRPTPATYGYSTGGWNAVATAGKVIEAIAPRLGLAPTEDDRFNTSSNVQATVAVYETE
jgi:cell division protein FtsI (penicillin-binding protein 3)